jgi:hypothetical protein
MEKATVFIKLWINLGKHSNNCPLPVETTVGKGRLKEPLVSDLLGTGCGKQIWVKV